MKKKCSSQHTNIPHATPLLDNATVNKWQGMHKYRDKKSSHQNNKTYAHLYFLS